ncbi:hypothetical protein D918_03895 [Trichuris suis]|nr:hypothetical protein D918_03895 [Trichuris suis]
MRPIRRQPTVGAMSSGRFEIAGSAQRIQRSSVRSKSSDFSIESLVGSAKEESSDKADNQKQIAGAPDSEDLAVNKCSANVSLLCNDADSSSLSHLQPTWAPEAVNYWSQLTDVSSRLQPMLLPADAQTCFFVSADYPTFVNQMEGTNAQLLFATDAETQAIPASIWARQCFQVLKQVSPLLLHHHGMTN